MRLRRAGAACVAVLALGTPALILAHRAPLSGHHWITVSSPASRSPVAATSITSAPRRDLRKVEARARDFPASTTTSSTTTPPPPATQPTTTTAPLVAVQVAAPPSSGYDWQAMAVCETGGNWQMHGPRYSGGLGFMNAAWEQWGGLEFAGNAGDASPAEQVIVAERIVAGTDKGIHSWGCGFKLYP